MVIGVIGAMQEEIEPLLDLFEDVESMEHGKNTYYITKYGSIDIIMAYSKIGKVFASLTATTMIEKFKVEKILFSGVAGAIDSTLNIGDLIVATALCQHDLDLKAFGHPYGYVPQGSVLTYSDKELNMISRVVASELNIKIKEGIIATGDQFVHSSEKKEFIKDTFNAVALEMEGASVAVVCDSFNIPFFVLRAISDSADGDANVDFDTFLESSSKKSANFIVKMLDKL
jgi:adenosylhomocysteine/aminodeoxyfutalosine nucleosidase